MAIRPLGISDFSRTDFRQPVSHKASHAAAEESAESAPVVNLQEELFNASEELASMLSLFGRFNRANRKNAELDSDFFSSALEEQAEEKLNQLIRQVTKLSTMNSILNFARGLFPDESDLMMALREMLLSRKLSELQKRKVKEAIKDLENFGDRQKMQSGINVSRLSKRFSMAGGKKSLSAKDLRNSYLRFLDLDLPAGFIYQDWIDEFGCDNRKRLLTFTLAALIADMKATEPGIHFDEFGPLSAKLSDARILHTLDLTLNERFNALKFREQLRNGEVQIAENDIVSIYMKGLIDFQGFKPELKQFMDNFMPLLFIRQKAEVIQTIYNIYNITPDFIFSDEFFKDKILNTMSVLINELSKKEKTTGIWAEYYI
ncbi:type III secretion system gatekeeper subunit SctW [Erwinia mallotivora]|uniref:Invasion protein n=1 Tax=Erwinia mallotivora TaxID=69222 RepID=A0A014NRS4_9GAMM|nr:type III secretion system gatekeeper subunit SctW [Erwinia mallotivora]EXU76565.1 invasion protein [Erwinia mallotivora]